MDMALCVIDKTTFEMQYAGAYNSVFIVRKKEIIELKADKMPIGIHAVELGKKFKNQTLTLEKNDMIYLFSDGYADQFGGEEGVKFKQKPFKELLTKVSESALDKQQKVIEKTILDWQGDQSQLDDMMILGIRI